MTRTQKLGLCTWLPEDPVCLAEVNDNFTRLDDSGGRALRLAEAGLVQLGGLMAAQAHQGGHAAYANMQVDAFRDSAQISAYAGVFYRGKCVELLTAGLADGTVKSSTIDSGGDFNAANITRSVDVTQTWANLFTFHPDAFGTLTNLHLQTANSSSTSHASQVKLSIWDAERDEMILETQMGTISRGSGADQPVDFPVELLLDPNKRYAMKLWVESAKSASVSMSSLVFSVTPVIYNTGSVTMQETPIPAETTRVELLLHSADTAPEASLRFDAGEYSLLHATQIKPDALPGGASCTLRRYTADIPAGAQTAQLKLSLSGNSCKVYDYALVML